MNFDWLTAAPLPLQSSDKEHGEEEAVWGQPGAHFLRVSQEERQENSSRHDTHPGARRVRHHLRADLASRGFHWNAEQPLPGPAHQEAKDSRWDPLRFSLICVMSQRGDDDG